MADYISTYYYNSADMGEGVTMTMMPDRGEQIKIMMIRLL